MGVAKSCFAALLPVVLLRELQVVRVFFVHENRNT